MPAPDQELETVEDYDPRRCQGDFNSGYQCHYKAVEGHTHCPKHRPRSLNSKPYQMYQLGEYQRRHEDFLKNPDIKSLHGEVGILRLTLEQIIKDCSNSNNKLILYSSKIGEMVTRIRETLVSCHKLEMQMGQLLNKNQVVALGERIVAIIVNYIPDPAKVEAICNEIGNAIMEIGNINEAIANEINGD